MQDRNISRQCVHKFTVHIGERKAIRIPGLRCTALRRHLLDITLIPTKNYCIFLQFLIKKGDLFLKSCSSLLYLSTGMLKNLLPKFKTLKILPILLIRYFLCETPTEFLHCKDINLRTKKRLLKCKTKYMLNIKWFQIKPLQDCDGRQSFIASIFYQYIRMHWRFWRKSVPFAHSKGATCTMLILMMALREAGNNVPSHHELGLLASKTIGALMFGKPDFWKTKAKK